MLIAAFEAKFPSLKAPTVSNGVNIHQFTQSGRPRAKKHKKNQTKEKEKTVGAQPKRKGTSTKKK